MTARTINLPLERLRRLPQRANEVWEAGMFRSPIWMAEEEDERPYRPWTAVCISTGTGKIGAAGPRPNPERVPGLVLEAIADLATKLKPAFRPRAVMVKDSDLAAELGPLLEDIEIELIKRPQLPTFEEARRDLYSFALEALPEPEALRVPGVRIEHLRAFAEAACEFHAAAPWRHLMQEDLLEIIAPKSDDGLGFATVMGSFGREYGLAFFASQEHYERLFEMEDVSDWVSPDGVWSFTFSEPHILPFRDLDAWEEHQLPLVDEQSYPWLGRFGAEAATRPTPKQWAFVEGLLRAIARTTEAEMDSGRWTKTVETIDGPAEYVLALMLQDVEPRIPVPTADVFGPMELTAAQIDRLVRAVGFTSQEELDQYIDAHFPDGMIPHQPPQTPLDRAQDLVYKAARRPGRLQLQLIRQALEICPDCAEAYVLLAERHSGVERLAEVYAEGVAAGERALGPQMFEECAGEFWYIPITRGYMRARLGLASCLEVQGKLDEAVGHYRELLRLNPDDNQEVRYSLVASLIRLKRLEEVEQLLDRYAERSGHWDFAAALAAYVREGDSPKARELLATAHSANPWVRKYLLCNAPLPDALPDTYERGHEDEATLVAAELHQAWDEAPGALDWLEAQTKAPKSKRRRRRK